MPLTYQPFEESHVLDALPLATPPAKPAVNLGEAERIGSLVGGVALAVAGLSRRSLGGLLISLVGGALIYRGSTGHCKAYAALGKNSVESPVIRHKGIKVEKSIIIDRPAEELFTYWRHFENLGTFMSHVESVTVLDQKRSHWKVKAPLGRTVEWDAEIINEHPDEMISWQSLPGADVKNAGTVRFTPAAIGTGTEVRVLLEFHPPAGVLGAWVAKLFGESPEQQISDDLAKFRMIMEAGRAPLA